MKYYKQTENRTIQMLMEVLEEETYPFQVNQDNPKYSL